MASPGGKGGRDKRPGLCYAGAMTGSRPAVRFAIVAALFTAGAAQANPPRQSRDPLVRVSRQPYPYALGAVANYQSCGVNARPGALRSLNAGLRAGEAAARAKGFGPMLDQLRAEYQAMLAVSTTMACALGPSGALKHAREAVSNFRRWVEASHPPGSVRIGN